MSSFRLAAPDGEPLPAALPGQFLTIRLRRTPDGAPLIRTYSLSGSPGAAEYRISVKREPHGAGSTYLHDEVRVGQTIESRRAARDVHAAARREPRRPRVGRGRRHAGARDAPRAGGPSRSTRAGVVVAQRPQPGRASPSPTRVRGLLASLPGAHAEFCYSQPGDDDRPRRGLHDPGAPVGRHARTTGDPAGRGRPTSADRSASWTSSRPSWPALGIDPARIFTERFGAHARDHSRRRRRQASVAPHVPAGPGGAGPAVSFARSNLTVNWDTGYASCSSSPKRVPCRCSGRAAPACVTRARPPLLSGSVDYSPEPVDRPGEGNALVCCSRPRDDLVLDLCSRDGRTAVSAVLR